MGLDVLGIATSASGANNNISGMTFDGDTIYFDGTMVPPESPSYGDVIRVTATGLLRAPANHST